MPPIGLPRRPLRRTRTSAANIRYIAPGWRSRLVRLWGRLAFCSTKGREVSSSFLERYLQNAARSSYPSARITTIHPARDNHRGDVAGAPYAALSGERRPSPHRRPVAQFAGASLRCPKRCHGRDHAARKGAGGVRQDDGGQGALFHRFHDAILWVLMNKCGG